jgi:hypothetical protein
MEVVQAILDSNRRIVLEAADVALLVLIRSEVDADADETCTLPHSTLRSLYARIDTLQGNDPRAGERRLNESVGRLEEAGCIALADLFRLQENPNANYQVTAFGDALYQRQVGDAAFSGEPLTAILRSFITLLDRIVCEARAANNQEDWDYDVIQPMQHGLRAMLEAVALHQKELERQHTTIREFLPELLNEPSEQSISLCKEKLTQVFETIGDLQAVVLSAVSKANVLIDEILGAARQVGARRVDGVCDETSRRLRLLERWTSERTLEWIEHHNVVHGHLRSNVLIDKNRRITEALRRAVVAPPDWTLNVCLDERVHRMRSDMQSAPMREPPRLPKDMLQRRRSFEFVHADQVPVVLNRYLVDALFGGEAYLSHLMSRADAEQGGKAALAKHLPWLIGAMLDAGRHDRTVRYWTPATGRLTVEEMRVTR